MSVEHPQVLTELCTISGPFSRVLGKLKDELIRSIYSNYYAMEQTGLQFRQLPYFKAAERLEADNKHLTQEKEAFRKVLQRRQVCTQAARLAAITAHTATLQHYDICVKATCEFLITAATSSNISANCCVLPGAAV